MDGAGDAREEAIVVLNGCFCPIHCGHAHSLVQAKRLLESSGSVRVVAGYFAVAPNRCVRKKLGKLEGWQTLDARLDMCRAAALDIYIAEPGWALSAAAYGGWRECGAEMVRLHHTQATQVFSVPTEAKARLTVEVSSRTHLGLLEHTHAELTSTVIRAELARAGACGETVDDLVRRRLLGAAVGERMKRWIACSTRTVDTERVDIIQDQEQSCL